MKIFVNVAAFCEPHLALTLDSLFQSATDPERIHVGLVDQSFDATADWLATRAYRDQVRHLQIDPIQSCGVSWARHIAQSLYQGEDCYLQIDSHTLFRPGWDSAMLDLLENLEKSFTKPIISCYPPGFEFDENGGIKITQFPPGQVFFIIPEPHAKLQPDNATLTFKTDLIAGADVIPGYHLAGGFIFCRSRFVEEVPYDPFMYFHGEEQNLSLRAYTRGWTPLHIRNDWIPVFHLYKQAGAASHAHHWHPDYEAKRTRKWNECQLSANRRLISLIRGELCGSWGLGTTRSLQDFIDLSGLDYARYLDG